MSSFLLPNIGCQRKHSRLQKYYDLLGPAPKSPYEHHLVFKEIYNKRKFFQPWQSQILYFSEAFINEVRHNKEWLQVKFFFSEALRKKLTISSDELSFRDLFLSAKKLNRFRPPPFIIDTAKYIFNICVGSGLGVKPATDEQYLPIKDIQNIYIECYGLDYIPTIMVPSSLTKNDNIYFSLLCPPVKINTFKTNQSNSTISELEQLKNVLLSYQTEFTDPAGAAFGSSLYTISKEINFSFYHYQASDNKQIKNSSFLPESDKRFLFSYSLPKNKFASDAKLFRGCIQLFR